MKKMLMFAVCFLAVLSVVVAKDSGGNGAASIVNSVNSDPASTWKAGHNNAIPVDQANFGRLMGLLPRNRNAFKFAPIKYRASANNNNVNAITDELPERFDARERWPMCNSVIAPIKDQSNCGSCWAVSAASVFSDRLCIASGGAVAKNLSAEHLNNCCYRCGHGCDGGFPEGAWAFFARHGIVTGGAYGSNEGCQPYSIYSCGRNGKRCIDKDPDTPECAVKTCSNSKYTGDYRADLHYVKEAYSLPNSEEEIMAEIYKHGPVQAGFYVYTDFMYYKSGIYRYTRGEIEGGHAIKIIGWGAENGTKYWLCANSWTEYWGEKGLFRIIRGQDECDIEGRVLAGLPRVPVQ
ncbi:Cysteine peptidase, cysteine active site,Peptidase C1A, papain C-terminal,Cysteine peptidase [Cinara cedri]|uniref:Cysteine peptidase, cysteine active site,Peptidase C1A, papain C-terminal,Cysteine peptidase n=1 Tax=Cinara cedri TaxID=506608 RepID=A0A5E4MJV2_9HEMI|nr:Cysteine peptidase, cysteine active site,Peptidase C1A, papain C-terminal,Cysteine peptidase [Cinara cedri]